MAWLLQHLQGTSGSGHPAALEVSTFYPGQVVHWWWCVWVPEQIKISKLSVPCCVPAQRLLWDPDLRFVQ